MSRKESTQDAGERRFPSTDWTVLVTLRDPNHPDFHRHLTALVERYWKPAYHFLRTICMSNRGEVRDLTQQFFTMLLEKQYWDHLDPEKGSFRSYLKTALRHFVANASRAESRRRRHERPVYAFEEAEADWERLAPAAADLSPEAAFDRAWIHSVVAGAVETLRERLSAQGKGDVFSLFHAFYLVPSGFASPAEGIRGERTAPSYADLAKTHGLREDDVDNRLRYARRVLREILKERVRKYVAPGEDPERELDFLLSSDP